MKPLFPSLQVLHPLLTYSVKDCFSGHEKILIVPDGGMLFESAGIADILMQANRLHPEGAGKSAGSS